ncbi:TlpA family protein disulfide reductase, partial [Vibrio parahaemolyticus]|nr:TlpA family protein disulfide reductase [Vibrio parahaemolyticus]
VVIGDNVGSDLDLVREYVEENNLTFPVALDSEADIASEYLVSGLPTTYFIDEDGIIYGRYPGMMTYNMMLEFSNETRKY